MTNDFLIKIKGKISQILEDFNGSKPIAASNPQYSQGFLTISLTMRCNFNCPHCIRGYAHNKDLPARDLSFSVIEKILQEGKKIGFKFISFTGGEPIMHPRFEEIVSLAAKHDYVFDCVTNCWLYDKYWPVLNKYKKNLRVMLLSLDGATPEMHDYIRNKPGSFGRVIRAIKFFKEKDVPISISTTFNKKNFVQFEEITKLCFGSDIKWMKCGAMLAPAGNDDFLLGNDEKKELIKQIIAAQKKAGDSFRFMVCANLLDGLDQEEFSDLIPNYKKFIDFCPLLSNKNFYVDHEGGVLPCCDVYKEYKNKPTIGEKSFEDCLSINMDLINELKKKRLWDLMHSSGDMNNTCSYCSENFGKYLDLISKKK